MKILLSFKLPHALLIIFYFMKDILNILKDKMEEAQVNAKKKQISLLKIGKFDNIRLMIRYSLYTYIEQNQETVKKICRKFGKISFSQVRQICGEILAYENKLILRKSFQDQFNQIEAQEIKLFIIEIMLMALKTFPDHVRTIKNTSQQSLHEKIENCKQFTNYLKVFYQELKRDANQEIKFQEKCDVNISMQISDDDDESEDKGYVVRKQNEMQVKNKYKKNLHPKKRRGDFTFKIHPDMKAACQASWNEFANTTKKQSSDNLHKMNPNINYTHIIRFFENVSKEEGHSELAKFQNHYNKSYNNQLKFQTLTMVLPIIQKAQLHNPAQRGSYQIIGKCLRQQYEKVAKLLKESNSKDTVKRLTRSACQNQRQASRNIVKKEENLFKYDQSRIKLEIALRQEQVKLLQKQEEVKQLALNIQYMRKMLNNLDRK